VIARVLARALMLEHGGVVDDSGGVAVDSLVRLAYVHAGGLVVVD